MNEPDVMVYLMTGFLDSGKTGFLKFTLKQDYFQIDEKHCSFFAKMEKMSMMRWKC